MKAFLLSLIILTSLSFRPVYAATAVRCEALFQDSATVSRKTETAEDADLKALVKAKNPSKTIRSSAGHFWRVTKKIIKGDIPSELSKKQRNLLEKLMKVEGWVIGDLHNGNVGPIRLGVTAENPMGKIDYTALDYDDPAPKGSLIFDFVHHVIAAKAVETPVDSRISKKDMFDGFMMGLKGKTYESPERISKLLEIDPAEFRDLEIKKAKKFTAANGSSLIKDNVRSSEIPREEIAEVTRVAQQAIGRYYEILDVGGREKDSGGSAGALRYILLVKEKATGDQFLFEMKEEPESAVEEYDKQPQFSHADTLKHYVNKNNDQDIRFRSNLAVTNEGRTVEMTLRPKPLYFFDYANDGSRNSAFKEFRDLTLFNSFWLGFKQRRDDFENASQLLEIIKEEGKDKVYDALKELTRELNRFYEDQSRDFRDAQAAEKKKSKDEKKKDK